MMMLAFIVALAGLFTLLSNVYSIQCYNDHDSYKQDHEKKFGFTVVCLVLAIIALICGSAGMVMAYRNDNSL